MATLMTADDPSVKDTAPTPIYGLFTAGGKELVMQPDSFLSYSYMNDSRVSDYPQEAGGFQSYNKVETPYDVRIQVTKGGTASDVGAFLQVVETLQKASNLELYDMITPERTYSSGNVYKISHEHRRDHGANMVTVDIYIREIRVTASAFYSNTTSPTTTGNLAASKSPAATDSKQGGTVQGQTPTKAQTDPVVKALEEMPIYDSGAAG